MNSETGQFTYSSRQLRRRLVNIVGQDHKELVIPIVQKVNSLMNNGIDFVIKWLKNANELVINYINGTTITSQGSPWVDKTKGGFPVLFLDIRRSLGLKKALEISFLYKWFRRDFPDAQSVQKEVTAILSPYQGPTDLDLFTRDFSRFVNTFVLRKFNHSLPGLDCSTFPNIGKFFSNLESGPSRPDPVKAFKVLAPYYNDLKDTNAPWQSIFYPLQKVWPENILDKLLLYPEEWINHSGVVSGTLEAGGKLRLFASPHKVLQCVLDPLMRHFSRIRDALGTDCTKNQAEGAIFAQNALKKGICVHSIDMSSATHRFPLQVQLSVARAIGIPDVWIRILERAFSSPFKVIGEISPYFNDVLSLNGYQPGVVQWSCGQPLGLKPSISLFGLTHNLIIAYLCDSLGLDPEQSFRVLGDDVIIVDDNLSIVYTRLITSLNVRISEQKSFHSRRYAEFAGFKITPDWMLRPGTFPPCNVTNYLDLAIKYGCDLGEEASWYQKLSYYAYCFMRGEFIPKDPQLYAVLLKVSSDFMNSICTSRHFRAKRWYNQIRNLYLDEVFPWIEELCGHSAPFNSPRTLQAFAPGDELITRSLDKLYSVVSELVEIVPNFLEYINSIGNPILEFTSIKRMKYDGSISTQVRCMIGKPGLLPVPLDLQESILTWFVFYREATQKVAQSITNLVNDVLLPLEKANELLTLIDEEFMSHLWLPPKKNGSPNSLGLKIQRKLQWICRQNRSFKPIAKGINPFASITIAY